MQIARPTVSSASSPLTSPTRRPPSLASSAPPFPSSDQATVSLSTPTRIGSASHRPTPALPAITLHKTHRTSSPALHTLLHSVWETSGRDQLRWRTSWPHCRSSDSGFLPALPRNHPPLPTRERRMEPLVDKKKKKKKKII